MSVNAAVRVVIGGHLSSSLTQAASQASARLRALGMDASWLDQRINAVNSTQSAIAANQAARNHYRQQALDAVGLGAPLALAIKAAMEFESAMADVKKVVSFDTPQQFAQMGKDIMDMSKHLPMTAVDISKIVAAAGQSGIAREKLLGFAEAAGKMGVAFDITADEAGQTMATWWQGLGLGEQRTLALADSVNYLSNNMNAKAKDLAEVVTRIGAVGMSAGLSEAKVAALGAAFLSVGASPEIAATSLKNFTNALTKGSSASKGQQEAFKAIGLSSTALARDMQKDAQKTIERVIGKVAALPAHQRSAIVGELFGEESKAAIMPLLTNLDLLKQSFKLVGDQTKYLGSMQAEYDERSKTTANNWQLMKNRINVMGITIGSILLPPFNEFLTRAGVLMDRLADWNEANPRLARSLVYITAGLLAGKVAMIAFGWAGTYVKGAVLGAKLAVDLISLALATLRARLMLVGGPFGVLRLALMALVSPVMLVTAAVKLLTLVLYASAIGAVIGAIALGGMWIYNNWNNVTAAFHGFKAGFMAAIKPVMPLLQPVITGVSTLWDQISALVAPIEGAEGAFTQLGENGGRAVGEWVIKLVGLGQQAMPYVVAGIERIEAAWVRLEPTAMWAAARLVQGSQMIVQGSQNISQVLGQVWAEYGGYVTGGIGLAVQGFGMIWDKAAALPALWTSVGDQFMAMVEAITGAAGRWFDALKTRITEAVLGPIREMKSLLGSAWESVFGPSTPEPVPGGAAASTAVPEPVPGQPATSTAVPGGTAASTAMPGPPATSTAVPGGTAASTAVPGQPATSTVVPGGVTPVFRRPANDLVGPANENKAVVPMPLPQAVGWNAPAPAEYRTPKVMEAAGGVSATVAGGKSISAPVTISAPITLTITKDMDEQAVQRMIDQAFRNVSREMAAQQRAALYDGED